jgi:hypothetical protein
MSTAFAQPIHITVEEAVLKEEGLKAMMVSNQYGVLRYFAFQHKLEKDSAHTFSVMRRRDEQLAFTLVKEEDRDGLFSFSNTTYTGLEDGAVIRVPAKTSEGRQAFQTIDLRVEGAMGAKDVKLMGPLGKRTTYTRSGTDLKIEGLLKEETGVFALIQLPEEERYRYYMGPMDGKNDFTVSAGALGDSVAFRQLILPYPSEWQGRIIAYRNDTPYYLYMQSQAGADKVERIRYAWPVGERFDSVQVMLSALKEEGNVYFGTYETLPERLTSFRFEKDFISLESKGYTFSNQAEEGDYYAVSYYYSLGEGMPIPNWHIWGPLKGQSAIDFILPDLPAELYDMIPELNEVANPIAVDKTSFKCTRSCDHFDYGKDPAGLSDNSKRYQHSFATRRKLRDFEEE